MASASLAAGGGIPPATRMGSTTDDSTLSTSTSSTTLHSTSSPPEQPHPLNGNTSTIRIATYNILSSGLATPQQYPRFEPEVLRPENRLPKILSKLQVRERRECREKWILIRFHHHHHHRRH